MNRLPSFSQWARAIACPSSETLPRHPRARSKAAARGEALHKFMEIYVSTNRDRAAALAATPAAYREEAARLDVSRLALPPQAATEQALCVDLAARTARTVETLGHRGYPAPTTPWETFGTVDLLGVAADGSAVVWDYKFGALGSDVDAEDNPQLALAAFAALLLVPATTCAVAIVYERDGVLIPVYRSEPYTMETVAPILNDCLYAARVIRGDAPAKATTRGDHCRYCPAFDACPSQHELLRIVTGHDAGEWLAAADKADAYARVIDAERVIKAAKASLREHAVREPIPLGNGKVYGMTAHGEVRAHKPRGEE